MKERKKNRRIRVREKEETEINVEPHGRVKKGHDVLKEAHEIRHGIARTVSVLLFSCFLLFVYFTLGLGYLETRVFVENSS